MYMPLLYFISIIPDGALASCSSRSAELQILQIYNMPEIDLAASRVYASPAYTMIYSVLYIDHVDLQRVISLAMHDEGHGTAGGAAWCGQALAN